MFFENAVGLGAEAESRETKTPVTFGVIDKLTVDAMQPRRTRGSKERPMKAPMRGFPRIQTFHVVQRHRYGLVSQLVKRRGNLCAPVGVTMKDRLGEQIGFDMNTRRNNISQIVGRNWGDPEPALTLIRH